MTAIGLTTPPPRGPLRRAYSSRYCRIASSVRRNISPFSTRSCVANCVYSAATSCAAWNACITSGFDPAGSERSSSSMYLRPASIAAIGGWPCIERCAETCAHTFSRRAVVAGPAPTGSCSMSAPNSASEPMRWRDIVIDAGYFIDAARWFCALGLLGVDVRALAGRVMARRFQTNGRSRVVRKSAVHETVQSLAVARPCASRRGA